MFAPTCTRALELLLGVVARNTGVKTLKMEGINLELDAAQQLATAMGLNSTITNHNTLETGVTLGPTFN